ncbi:cytosolic endo-beta-N-acetylglucosaminidase isoform X1 [Mucor ambiguus]|uniref:Cytosolic endo-beta-N-acetylglucosaminidase isoform X1 n=1 Tax=Mucor ambiguus TaxID=91626 RepID=A0A0C9N281_9FUNG|nr:cytosolic endo-beta-N-acetylglucosaminidase isoform X1 [Mucor ambiguus]
MPSRTLQKDVLAPTSFALKDMKQLFDWEPSLLDTFNVSNITLQPRESATTTALKPKLLLCHDMAGGYKEDKCIQGNDYQCIYYIQHWHLADTFVYFSHERVSIPPVNWTNACHRNGVQCLGTFLVEGNNQMHEMEALLHGPPTLNNSSDDPMRLWSPFYADKLVAIAKYYGFDGWLINIECEFFPFPTSPYFKAQELAKFLLYLTQTMHTEIPGSKVIWYDSMTTTGEIDWQNQLTTKNELFFENSDGIFLNYWWKKEYPELARRLAERHGKTGIDVYFGTDVWGRHTYGGGGFRSYKGVKAASSAQTSSALFGMAWTYEHFDKSEFEKMDRLFWCGGDYSEYPPPPPPKDSKSDSEHEDSDDSEDELMYGHKKGIADTVALIPAPGKDWFVTTFDRGFGKRFYYRGKKLLCQPWSHLSHQSILPNTNYREPIVYPIDKNIAVSCALQTEHGAYLGGTSLVVVGQRLNHRESRDMESEINIPLYQLNVNVSQGCQLKYIYRTLLTEDVKVILSCHFSLHASTSSDSNEFFNSWSLPRNLSYADEDGFRATITSTKDVCESRCFLLPATEETTGENGWITKTIGISPVTPGNQLFIKRIEVSVVVNTASLVGLTPRVIACLGYLGIIPIPSNTVELQIQNLRWSHTRIEKNSIVKVRQEQHQQQEEEEEDLSDIASQEVTLRYYGTLSWDSKSSVPSSTWKEVEYYIISHEVEDNVKSRTFLGTAFCNQYRISGLDCANKSKSHRIIVEAVDREGHITAQSNLDVVLA